MFADQLVASLVEVHAIRKKQRFGSSFG